MASSNGSNSTVPPFHRLLSFYSNRNPHDSETIRFVDSLRGNLSLGLHFPAGEIIALGRHLYLRNTSNWFSLNIHVPSTTWKTTPLENLHIDPKKEYGMREIAAEGWKQIGLGGAVEAAGLWALAADVKTGLLKGSDVESFREGRLLGELERRRRDRSQVLPFLRGGPINVAGHSWFVEKMYGVRVYRDDDGDGEGKKES